MCPYNRYEGLLARERFARGANAYRNILVLLLLLLRGPRAKWPQRCGRQRASQPTMPKQQKEEKSKHERKERRGPEQAVTNATCGAKKKKISSSYAGAITINNGHRVFTYTVPVLGRCRYHRRCCSFERAERLARSKSY